MIASPRAKQEAGSPRAEESSDRELLTAVPALEALSHRELNQILKHVKVRECKDKEIIIEEGDEGKDMFIIKTGNAVCTKAGLNGGDWLYSSLAVSSNLSSRK
jgi:signal-transduction protein with cAMP-binding, CBS, and nucleotidyltransferase domain